MTSNINLAPLLIPLGMLMLGWIIGFFDSNLRTAKKIKEAEQKAELAIHQAKAESQRAIEAAAAQSVLAAPPPADTSALKLGIDKSNRANLELDGQLVNTARLTSAQRKRLIDLTETMRAWVEGGAAQSRSAVSQPASRPLAAQTPSLKKLVPSPRAAQTPPIAASVSQPKPSRLAAVLLPPLKDAAAPLTSMAAQIEDILQTNLLGTPLENRGVHINESVQGSVVVMVGAQKYESISEVPDAEILAAIKAAVAEWERKYTPGI